VTVSNAVVREPRVGSNAALASILSAIFFCGGSTVNVRIVSRKRLKVLETNLDSHIVEHVAKIARDFGPLQSKTARSAIDFVESG